MDSYVTSRLIQVGCWTGCWNSVIWTRPAADLAFYMRQNILCTVTHMLACDFCPLPRRSGNKLISVRIPFASALTLAWPHLCARFLLNKLTGSYQINVCIYDLELTEFMWPWPSFKVTLWLKLQNLIKIMIVYTKSPKSVDELWMTVYECI